MTYMSSESIIPSLSAHAMAAGFLNDEEIRAIRSRKLICEQILGSSEDMKGLDINRVIATVESLVPGSGNAYDLYKNLRYLSMMYGGIVQ